VKVAIIEYQYYEESQTGHLIKNIEDFSTIVCRVLLTKHSSGIAHSKKTIQLDHSNQGKDVGAKLVGIDYLIYAGYEFDFLILLHDKRSPHSSLGDFWFKELTKIFTPKYFSILKKKITRPRVGICCSAKYLKSEYNSQSDSFQTSNNELLKDLISCYSLEAAFPYNFVAGTIFCCKWSPVKDFFTINKPLKIKATLETGNVQDVGQGTYTHSWERLMSWIITSKGYLIKGV